MDSANAVLQARLIKGRECTSEVMPERGPVTNCDFILPGAMHLTAGSVGTDNPSVVVNWTERAYRFYITQQDGGMWVTVWYSDDQRPPGNWKHGEACINVKTALVYPISCVWVVIGNAKGKPKIGK